MKKKIVLTLFCASLSCSVSQASEKITDEVDDPIAHNKAHPLLQHKPALVEILLKLDPKSLAAAASTSKKFYEVINSSLFQTRYSGLTGDDYANIIETELPRFFGKDNVVHIQDFLAGKNRAFSGALLRRLVSEKNSAFFKAADDNLFKYIMDNSSSKEGISLRGLMIASYGEALFTADMDGEERAQAIKKWARENSKAPE